MEQSIFTYCYKRFDAPGGGWGFYSYSDNIKTYFEKNNQIELLAGSDGYEVPKNRNVWLINQMTDYEKDIEQECLSIKKYHPEKFAYTKYDNISVFTFGRNLGREIVNESRPANKLVYTLVGLDEEVKEYPCFYFGNIDFEKMTRSFFKETNQNLKAKALSKIDIKVGERINREKVHKFLSGRREREDLLVELFYALINEQSGKKRPILICDEKDNIAYWIAAVTLLFPVEIAKDISFTTYDFLGNAIGRIEIPHQMQICGVYSPTINGASEEEATNYNVSSFENNEDVVLFDFECGIYPLTKKDGFEDLIRMFCRGDEKALIAYQEYIINNTNYRDFTNLYTAFYPIESEKEDLFKYYNGEAQKNIFFDNYPYLFDLESSDKVDKAIYLTKCAVDVGIYTSKQLFDDIYQFAAKLLQNPKSDFDRLKKIDSISGLVQSSADKFVKDIIEQNLNKWIEFMTAHKDTSTKKLIFVFRLLNPLNPNELQAVQKLCKRLSEHIEGKNVITAFVERCIAEKFNQSYPSTNAAMLLTLTELGADYLKCINVIVSYFAKWNTEYRSNVISVFENSVFAEAFFEKLKRMLLCSNAAVYNIYEIMDTLIDLNGSSMYAKKMYHIFVDTLTKTPLQDRKEIMKLVLSNKRYSYNQSFDAIVQSIYYNNCFDSADELADFSYMLFCKIINTTDYELPMQYVSQSLSKINCSKKNWKKAIAAIQKIDNRDVVDETVMEDLLEAYDYDDINSSPNDSLFEEKKPSFLKKIFRKTN